MRVPGVLAGVIGLAAVASLAAAPRAEAAELRGANIHLWNCPDGQPAIATCIARDLDALERAGANTARIDVAWSSLEPEADDSYASWYLERLDYAVRDGARRGIRTILTLYGTPCWAASAPASIERDCEGEWWSRGVTKYPPERSGDFADAVRFLIDRYRDVEPAPALEIWNEPNNPKFLIAADPAAVSTELTRAADAEVKAVRPETQVIAAATGGADAAFIDSMFEAGLAGHYDAISIHPYNGPDPPGEAREGEPVTNSFRRGIAATRDTIARHSGASDPIWLTELGWSSCRVAPTAYEDCVTEADQARFTEEAFRLVDDSYPAVEAVILYELRQSTPDLNADCFECQFGLISRDFATEKPGLKAFRAGIRATGVGPAARAGSPWSVALLPR